ncbi:MAG: carboxyl transferase domain-containing protein [Casimicrobiaceae bacterium]
MTHESTLSDLEARHTRALAMGGAEKLALRKAQGHLNARERLDTLLDAGSFVESGMFAAGIRAEVRERTPADGKIAGFGRIDGRRVAVVSNDFTVLGASSSAINGKKIRHVKETATRRGFPLVFLGESTGARMPDRMGAAGRAMLGQDPAEYLRLRQTPWVSALLGSSYGSSTWYCALSDFVVMRKGATMAVASSRVTAMAINQPVDAEELGGWKLHTATTGLVDIAVDTDAEALAAVRQFLAYLPGGQHEPPPRSDVPAGSDDAGSSLLEALPESRTQTYDMRRIIERVVDHDTLFELKPRFGKSMVTALARLDGHTIGVVANNPMFKGGAIDVDACRKATSFLVLCDTFNVPVVMLADQPGFLIGLEGEKRWAPGRIMNWLNALSQVTVPRFSIVVRKSYGQAYLNMGGGRNADETACWPTAELGFMDATVAVNVLHGVTRESDPARFETLREELARDTSAWDLAALYETQAVIDPRETRSYLRDLLRVYGASTQSVVGQHRLANWPTSY